MAEYIIIITGNGVLIKEAHGEEYHGQTEEIDRYFHALKYAMGYREYPINSSEQYFTVYTVEGTPLYPEASSSAVLDNNHQKIWTKPWGYLGGILWGLKSRAQLNTPSKKTRKQFDRDIENFKNPELWRIDAPPKTYLAHCTLSDLTLTVDIADTCHTTDAQWAIEFGDKLVTALSRKDRQITLKLSDTSKADNEYKKYLKIKGAKDYIQKTNKVFFFLSAVFGFLAILIGSVSIDVPALVMPSIASGLASVGLILFSRHKTEDERERLTKLQKLYQ